LAGAQGIKLTGKELEKALAGTPLFVASSPEDVEPLKDKAQSTLSATLNAVKCQDIGVYVQASTLGSLEALVEFLKHSKIPYSGVNIGPVHKKDVMKASVMLEHKNDYAVILAFDVKIEREAQEMADSLGVRIFSADIIYHLFDSFMKYREELRQRLREQYKDIAIFPCKLKILPNCVFKTRDPIVVGVKVEGGLVKVGTPLTVPSKNFCDIGIVSSMEANHKPVDVVKKGAEVCLKIDPIPGEAPRLLGRHFDEADLIVSKISRQSIDAVKDYFREDLQKGDWQLMVELKKQFQIL
jgi:translation initiation factor 5B